MIVGVFLFGIALTVSMLFVYRLGYAQGRIDGFKEGQIKATAKYLGMEKEVIK